MRVFITGVVGFLGSHIAEYLISQGHDVVGIDNLAGSETMNIPAGVNFHQIDCCDQKSVATLAQDCEAVFHCAALAYEGLSVFSPTMVCRSIFDASTSVFSAAIANRVKRIVFCSSMARYGTNTPPFQEDYTPKPQDPYGIAKVASEQVLKTLCEVHDTEYVIAVPHNIIGPRQKLTTLFAMSQLS